MDSCGKKVAARDIKIAALKKLKGTERKKLMEKKKELEKAAESNRYLNGALKECNGIIRDLKTQNEEQEYALKNIYEYLENLSKDQNTTAKMMKDLKSQKKIILHKLKELKLDFKELSN